jgi:RimJ/RimL family protein N-acetyltransferase
MKWMSSKYGIAAPNHPATQHGFVVEGTLRQYAFRNGEFVDVHVMSRIAA